MNFPGKGPTLIEHSPYLRDPVERAEQILDAAERNSVNEGLPPFTEDFRQCLRDQLLDTSTPNDARRE